MRIESENYIRNCELERMSVEENESGIELGEAQSVLTPTHDPSESTERNIEILREKLLKEYKGHHILWLQKILIECCYVKLRTGSELFKKQENSSKIHTMEPVPFHYISISLNVFKFVGVM